jgi:hypothetical protein
MSRRAGMLDYRVVRNGVLLGTLARTGCDT